MARSASLQECATGLGFLFLVGGCGGGGAVAGPSELAVTSGSNQSGTAGAQLANPLVVTLRDAGGHPLAGLSVVFQVTGGGGSVQAGTVTTDAQGQAQDRWTLGITVGPAQTVDVRPTASGASAVVAHFVATALPGPAGQIAVESGNGQSANPGTVVTTPPSVRVRDQYGNSLPGAQVTFAVLQGGGTLTGAVTTTDALGIATVGSWTLGPVAGANSITATVAGAGVIGNPVTLNATGRATWQTRALMTVPRHSFSTAVVNGIIYAIGGVGVGNTTLGTVEAYDPASNQWSGKAAMPTARQGFGIGVVNGIIYVMGGNPNVPLASVQAYDPATNSWTTKASMPTARGSVAAGVVNGIIYVVGGWNGTTFTNAVEAYDPATNSWTTKAPMPTARTGHSAEAAGGILYVAGGQALGGTVGTLEAYNPVTNTWSLKASMIDPRAGFAFGVVDGKLYAAGGRDDNGGQMNAVESYDPGTNGWSSVISLPTRRNSLKAAVVTGALYAIGGFFNNFPLGTNEVLRP